MTDPSSLGQPGEAHLPETNADLPTNTWFTPGVRGIGTASLLSDLGHEIPTSLLPSLLTVTLGAPAAALGLVEGIADGLAGAAKFAGGPLGDDPHRRRATAVAPPPPQSFLPPSAEPPPLRRSPSCAPARGHPAACAFPPAMPSSRTSCTPAPTAGPTGLNALWTTSAPSADHSSPCSSSH